MEKKVGSFFRKIDNKIIHRTFHRQDIPKIRHLLDRIIQRIDRLFLRKRYRLLIYANSKLRHNIDR